MLHIARFTFNPFQENTYVLHEGQEAIVVDPGAGIRANNANWRTT